MTDTYSQSSQSDSLFCKPIIDSVSQIEYYIVVDSMPEYPGGNKQMLNFLVENFKYPPEIDACCRIVVEYVIDTDGKMTNIKIIRGLQVDFDNETLRVMRVMPDWKPGKCDGKPVNVKMIFPWSISLQ